MSLGTFLGTGSNGISDDLDSSMLDFFCRSASALSPACSPDDIAPEYTELDRRNFFGRTQNRPRCVLEKFMNGALRPDEVERCQVDRISVP